MGAKIAAFLLTVTACITAAVILLSVLILAMNGYSESDAMWGLGTFVVFAFLASVFAGIGSIILVSRLQTRQFSVAKGLLIAIPVSSIVGVGLIFASALIGVGVAEFVRVNY
ncbi:MAG TPA: hypothetical protein PLP21_05470 [Pyrinomonadaceae bacterium]|nr:hypothetical protein [Acidobacteriota bacterium]HQZ95745.1 hypothetical protein [Pyrinomonadaceae bacterium]